jgi:hypothetical protein
MKMKRGSHLRMKCCASVSGRSREGLDEIVTEEALLLELMC